MAINKQKKKLIQISIPHEDAEHLDTLVDSFNKEGIRCTKSEVLLVALRLYIKSLVICAQTSKIEKKEEEPHKENKDA